MKISVCVPLYNGADNVGHALQCLEKQSHQPDEVIVVDDCSTDDGAKVVRSFDSLPIRYTLNDSNLGMVRNWNACLEKADCDLVAFLHQDDGYMEGFIHAVIKDFENHPAIGFWACRQEVFKGEEIPLGVVCSGAIPFEEAAKFMLTWDYLPPPTAVVFRVSALRDLGLYDPYYRYAAEPDLYLRLLWGKWNFFQSDKMLVWRTLPPGRASDFFASSPTYFNEWAYFLKTHVPPRETTNPGLVEEAVAKFEKHAMWSVEEKLNRGDVKSALEIRRVLSDVASSPELKKYSKKKIGKIQLGGLACRAMLRRRPGFRSLEK